jgi:hypothetical protein
MATQIDVVRDRIASVCASAPFDFLEAETPFDFSLQPTTQIDQVFRLTSESDFVVGGFAYTEERQDTVEIWVARKQAGAPRTAYTALLTDVSSLRAAIIRDGATGGGDYTVPDGAGFSVQHDDGQEYAVLRLTVPVNYEAEV